MKHNIVLTDKGVSDRCSKTLAVLDCVVVRLPSFEGLSAPVSSHPDMLIARLSDKELITDRRFFDKARDILSPLPVKWVFSSVNLSPSYPNEVLFDALAVGNTLYGKEGSVCPELLCAYSRFVPVRQGYARCSVAMLSDKCAVTSDIGLCEALTADGIDTLLISSGHIRLDGYDTGFIGGAGGRLSEDKYVFFGDIKSHPDGEDIIAFAREHKISAVSLSDEELHDHGGIILI